MDKISYTVFANGNSAFLRSFAIPLAEELEKLEGSIGIQNSKLPELTIFEHDIHLRAIELTTVGVGFVLFLPGWFAKKVLEEVYDIKIRPLVRKIICKADSIELFLSKNKHMVYTLSIFYEEVKVLVMVAAKEKKFEQLEAGIEKLPRIHVAAQSLLQSGEHREEVHLYIVSGGKVNVHPFIHENIESANQQIST